MHKRKKVENLLEEKLFFERRRSGPLRDGKNIVQLMIHSEIQNKLHLACTQVM